MYAASDYLNIGSSPAEEACAQVGSPDYRARAKRETAEFIRQIRRTLGSEPPGARLVGMWFPHDFGSYLEVVCQFEVGNEAAEAYAFTVEAEAPSEWDDLARANLGLNLAELLATVPDSRD